MLLDSNILIYATRIEHENLRAFILQNVPAVSIISTIEVLGYHRLRDNERDLLREFLRSAEIIPLSNEIANEAVRLRQQRKLSLGDSIIAATAIVHGRALITCNTSDFEWMEGINILDPFTTR